jgi:hypothetical protein
MMYFQKEEVRRIDFVRVDEGGTVVVVFLHKGNSYHMGQWIGYADQVRIV